VEDKYDLYGGGWSWINVASNVASISASTDRYGVNDLDYVTTTGAAYELSDSTGLHLLRSSGVSAVSAGQQGASALLLTTGEADYYLEATRKTTVLATSGVAEVTVGISATGSALVERLDTNGNLFEYQGGISASPTEIQTGVTAVSKARAGIVDTILTDGSAVEHKDSTNTWTTLDSNDIGVG
jgi:hypothetical protein